VRGVQATVPAADALPDRGDQGSGSGNAYFAMQGIGMEPGMMSSSRHGEGAGVGLGDAAESPVAGGAGNNAVTGSGSRMATDSNQGEDRRSAQARQDARLELSGVSAYDGDSDFDTSMSASGQGIEGGGALARNVTSAEMREPLATRESVSASTPAAGEDSDSLDDFDL